MNLICKGFCLAIYALAAAGLADMLAPGPAHLFLLLSALLLFIHAIEVVLAFRYVRLYRGSLASSILLTLLFGLLHWKPLANAHARALAGILVE
ncbi:hypothetical protein RCH09_002457 [Actimicrobium sp. GrIS 1.19]|uniref:hypothetical protein n=1 Tax=Actimicrobium sp. GrIS 1.19 TaxID=3071708 RepID=UPI002E0CAA2C|nr:hypothetical protein [Actimicrobium sp. GrIS 1.19]